MNKGSFSRQILSFFFKPRLTIRLTLLCLLISIVSMQANIVVKPQMQVSGTISDANGQPLPGASILEKGTLNGVTADFDGNYAITLTSMNATLTVSYVGFSTLDIVVGGRSVIDIKLQENTDLLDEVVVVGYGKSLKSDLTSAISTVKSNDIVNAPVSNVSNNLSGRMTGVLTYQSSGEAGKDQTTIRIRGANTTGNAQPLVIIDGIRGNMNTLNPSDIETVSVLKDAAAVAPFGLAAANGVILVTTKRGTAKSPTISYSYNYGIQNPVDLTKTLNSYQFAQMRNEIYLNDHPGDTNVPYPANELEEYRKVVEGLPGANYDKYMNSNNIHDIIRKDAPIINHSLSVSGGTENISYYASLGLLDQASMIPTSNYKRYNGVLNLDANISETLKVTFSVRMERDIRKRPAFLGEVTAEFGIYGRTYEIDPTQAIWFPNTDGLWGIGGFGYNPIGRIHTSGTANNKTGDNNYTIGLEKKLPLKGLSIKGNFNYQNINMFDDAWNEEPIYWDVDNTVSPAVYTKRVSDAKPTFNQSASNINTITAQGYINYDNTFGKHAVSGLFVAEYWDTDNISFSAGRRNYSILIPTLDMGSSNQADISNSGTASAGRSMGYVWKLGYNYDRKYLVDLSARLDEHYYFAPGHRQGFFPAVSLGWRIGKERFIADNYSWINELKLRASFGTAGNLAGAPYQYLSSFATDNEKYRLGGELVQGLYELSPANPNITWEKQKQTDIGIDLELWKSKLVLTADYFYQVRDNMLLSPDVTLPGEYGIGLPQENAGKMSNQGFELMLGTRNNFDNGINFDASFNLTFARNKLLEIFENPATYNDPNRRRTGRSLGALYGLEFLGFFKDDADIANSPEQKIGFYTVGDAKYADLNGDGVVDGRDEKVIGNQYFPELIFGLNLAASWKSFDVSALIQGAGLTDINRPGPRGAGALYNDTNQIEALDHWTPETPNAKYARWSMLSNPNNSYISSLTVKSGSYIRLKSFNIGYTLPDNLLGSLRLYLSGRNMLTWTKDELNSDPETAAGGGYRFANQKAISFGLDLTF